MAVAPAQLNGHTAVQVFADFGGGGQLLQDGIRGHVADAFGQGGLLQALQDLGTHFLHAGDNLAVGLELRIEYGKNLQIVHSFICAGNDAQCKSRKGGAVAFASHFDTILMHLDRVLNVRTPTFY